MNESDAMRLLAEANPVRVDSLTGLAMPAPILDRRLRRPLVLAAAVSVAAVAASLIAIFAFGGSPPQASRGGRLPSPLPTLEHPLRPDAKQVTLREATQELGAKIVLPDSSLAGSSDVGAIWTEHTGPVTDVAVTFPRPRLIVDYERPVTYPQPAPTMYATEARQGPGSMSTIDLKGVPALATAQNSDQLHQNFGSIEFVENGTVIRVMGHYDQATLQAVAQSIVDRSSPSTPSSELAGPGQPEIHVGSVAEADAQLPFEVVLPSARPLVMVVALPQQNANASFTGFFDLSATGPYEVVEQPANALGGIQAVAQLRTWANTCRSRVVCPIHRIVVVHDTHVLLIGAPGRPGGLTAIWLRGDRAGSILTWIQGPTDYAHGDLRRHVFKPRAALAVAASMIARGG